MFLNIKASKKSALRITREALKSNNLVYIAKANKKIKYNWGSSKIAYIGETSSGVNRITKSAADRAPEILKQFGFTHLDFYVVQPKLLQKVRAWELLEHDLLILFRCFYGDVPVGNSQGKQMSYDSISGKFKQERLEEIIRSYSE
jgi:hypothetical protein